MADPSPVPPAHQGLASLPAAELGGHLLAAWDAFLALAAEVDLEAPTRLPGWRVREVLVHLGTWDDRTPLQGLVASARNGTAASEPVPDADDQNARVTAAHMTASREEVLEALHRARDGAAGYFADGLHDELGRRDAASVLGPLPLSSVIHAGCYELAVHALDLAPERPDVHLLDRGLAALCDVTGALAHRQGLRADVALLSPDAGWQLRVDDEGWTVEAARQEGHRGTSLSGPLATLLDVSSGRANAVTLLLSRRLVLHGAPGLLALAPIVEAVPGVPGGPVLRATARHLSGAGRLVGRLPFGRRPDPGS